MANNIPSLEGLTKNEILKLMDACVNFDAGNILGPDYKAGEVVSYGIPEMGLYWKTKRDFENDITLLTKTGSVVEANKVLEQRFSSAPTQPPQSIPTKAERESEEAERVQGVRREASEKEATKNAENSVETAIKKQQEIYAEQIQKAKEVEAALKNQKVYYKVEKVPVEETQEIKNLKQQAEADPKKFIDDTAARFKDNPNLKNLAPDEARVAAQQAAVTTYEVLTGDSPLVQAATINQLVSHPEIFNKLVPDLEQQNILKGFAANLSEQKLAQFELGGQFVDYSKIDGFKNIESTSIQFSATPQEGSKEFDINQNVLSPSIGNFQQQNLLLDNLTGFGEREIKSQILLGVGSRLESYIATLPTNNLLAKTYNSEIVQLGLSSLGIVEAAPWAAVEGSLFGKIVVGSGFGSVAGFIQAKTGINLGIKLAVEAGAKVAVSTGTKVATGAVTGTGLAAGITAAFAWTGPLAPIIGAVGAFLVNVVGAKVISKVIGWVKDNAQKYGKYIVGFVGAGFGFILGGWSILGAIVGGVVGYGGAAVISGGISGLGASFTSLGSGIVGFFGALGGAFLGAIGMPILVTLLVFPVVVALILFIINSGAYVVPPQSNVIPGGQNPYMDVTKTVSPECRNRTSSGCVSGFPDVVYTVTIHAKRGALTNIKIANEYTVSGGSAPVPNPNIPEVTNPPESISPTKDFTFKYTLPLGSEYNNTIVTDIITITVDTTEKTNFSAATSASVVTGNPPIDCPIVGGSPLWLSYVPGDESSRRHGNNAYWNQSGGAACRYPLPQVPGCFGPTDTKASSNVCYNNSQGTCSYYGYSLDIFPSGSINTPVLVPRVAGKSLAWSCVYAFANGNAGSAGHTYRCQSGEYTLNFTHMNFGARIGTLVSGDKLGEMYPLPGGAHVHLEFAINGQYQRPENYFCSK